MELDVFNENQPPMVTLRLDGELSPLSLAKSIIDSNLLKGKDFREFVDYLGVHVSHHCQHGLRERGST